jgi:osmoprotectant transport system permease protein
MTTTFAFLGQFGDAIQFIFQERESVGGGVMVGGLSEIGGFAKTHLLVSFVAMAVACLIAIPTGLYLGHKGKGEFLAISVSNVGRAVPAVVLLFFFIAYVGNGFSNVAFVLFLLAVPPILTNTYVGVRQVSPELVDAARGMGMTGPQIVRKIRLPLALPTIFAGIRTSVVSVLATATIGTYANLQTLGEPILIPQQYGFSGQLGAAMVVALMTLAADAGIGLAQQAVTPKGIKLAEEPRAVRRRLALPTRRREAST